jgi:hypothetical protein
MTTNEARHGRAIGLMLHGQAGLLIIFLAETLLFSGNQIVGRWFTRIVWTARVPLTHSPGFRAESYRSQKEEDS